MFSGKEKPKSVISIPTSSSILTVDTRDGLTYDSDGYPTYVNPYNVNIYKNESIFQGKINRIALTNFSMKYTIQNVNPYNNVFVLQDGNGNMFRAGHDTFIDELGQVRLSEIVPGFYEPEALASALQNILVSASALGINTWSVYFDKEKCRFTITNSSNLFFSINPMFGKDKGFYSFGLPLQSYKRTSTLATLMGFDNIGRGNAKIFTSGIPSMNYTSYIDVVSNTITKNQFTRDVSTDNDTGSNLLARIYLNNDMKDYISKTTTYSPPVPPVTEDTLVDNNYTYNFMGMKPMMINWQASYPKQIRWDKEAFLAGIQIQLRDDTGNLLYYQDRGTAACGDTGYALMTFMISEEDD